MGPDLYYALGGGLGHLTRARAVLGTLGVQARVLAPAHPESWLGLDLLPLPVGLTDRPGDLGAWLARLLWEQRPQRLWLDSFPCGLFGELCGIALPPGLAIHYLARLLRWDRYARRIQGTPPPLDRVHLLEPLNPDHTDWLAHQGAEPIPLRLETPDLPPPTHALARLAALPPPRWLVVHSGPAEEIRELIDYARDLAAAEGLSPTLVLIAPHALPFCDPGILRLDASPAHALYPLAERIVTACGFNTMSETLAYRHIHRFIPMARALDDQYARAAQRRDD
ncbi:hypothetical protein [uncultured Thiodictyon sp.]|uniref:hypothetical protein n=1 Tax=uncultured Thiodictyon sp. TaxID=1846217 RepID=UPI0026011886|nr:hypothetical protein [uncultured Thiodictyon sp.]